MQRCGIYRPLPHLSGVQEGGGWPPRHTAKRARGCGEQPAGLRAVSASSQPAGFVSALGRACAGVLAQRGNQTGQPTAFWTALPGRPLASPAARRTCQLGLDRGDEPPQREHERRTVRVGPGGGRAEEARRPTTMRAQHLTSRGCARTLAPRMPARCRETRDDARYIRAQRPTQNFLLIRAPPS